MEKFTQPEKEPAQEQMSVPEIAVHREPLCELTCILFKIFNNSWGGDDYEIGQQIVSHFKNNPLPGHIINFFNNNKFGETEGADEETLINLALAVENPERETCALNTIRKHKPWIKDPDQLLENFRNILNEFKKIFSATEVSVHWDNLTENDRQAKELLRGQMTDDITKLINFFHPQTSTTILKRLTIMPSNFLLPIKSGAGFNFGDEYAIESNISNRKNFQHEFLHSVINPIVDKLESLLTDDQKESIVRSAKKSLVQDYGEHWYSLLCETLIRTYNDIYSQNEKPLTENSFKARVDSLTESEFVKIVDESPAQKERLAAMQIASLSDFKAKAGEYFQQVLKNQLGEIIFELYKKYDQLKLTQNINFEDFILTEFPKLKF